MNSVLNRLHEIASAVMHAAEATDLETVLDRIAHASRELAQTKYAALGIPDGKGGLRYFKTSGINEEYRARMGHLPKGHGLIGAIMEERRVIRLTNLSADSRSAGFSANHPVMTTFLGVPVAVGNQLFGMLYLCDKINDEPFNDDDQLLIETLAGYAALAIAGAELSQHQNRLSLLEERERIAMELHDGIIQSLYGIGMQVDILRKARAVITPDHVDHIVDSLNDVIEDIRSYIANLRHGGAPVSIRECLLNVKDRLHPPDSIDIRIDAPNARPPFTPAAFESICLIVNEALSNAIRHAEAKKIEINAELNKQQFQIFVRDDGQGFEVNKSNHHNGLGLNNMRHRARIFGGDIHIDSTPGQGTTLRIQIPIGTY